MFLRESIVPQDRLLDKMWSAWMSNHSIPRLLRYKQPPQQQSIARQDMWQDTMMIAARGCRSTPRLPRCTRQYLRGNTAPRGMLLGRNFQHHYLHSNLSI